MKFGIFYEHQLPRPWSEGREQQLFQDALSQVELADELGIDYAWEVEHHFQEEYSHSSAPGERREVAEAAAIVGTPDECIERLRTLQAGGVEQVLFSGASLDDLRLFAAEVMPEFQ